MTSSSRAIVTGSHLDSVPGGGAFDGPLGVASALAAVDVLRAQGRRPDRAVAIAVFPEEEGSRFGLACLGSRLLTGAVAAGGAAVGGAAAEAVRPVVEDVSARGAEAVLEASERFDGIRPEHLRVPAAAIEQAQSGITARLSVGVWASVASGLLPRALSSLAVEHPGIRVQTSELAPEETADAVRDGLLDLSFVIDYSSHTIDPDPALQRTVVAVERLDVIVLARPTAARLAASAVDVLAVQVERDRVDRTVLVVLVEHPSVEQAVEDVARPIADLVHRRRGDHQEREEGEQ